jgi:hypothetical protein
LRRTASENSHADDFTMRLGLVWKYGSVFAAVRLLALWFVVDVAHYSSGWPQVVGYLLEILLMLPEAGIARDARLDMSLWTREMALLILGSSYVYFLLLWLLGLMLRPRRTR